MKSSILNLMKWRMSVYEGIHVKCIKATTVLGLLYKRVYKKWSFSTDSEFVSKFAVLQRCEGARQMAEDVSRKELQRILHCVSQNPWNPTPACWFRICTPSLPSLRIAMHHCQAVLTRPTWLRVGSEPRQTDCWKANLLPSGTSQAPSYSCSRPRSVAGFLEVFEGGTETHLKQKLVIICKICPFGRCITADLCINQHTGDL